MAKNEVRIVITGDSSHLGQAFAGAAAQAETFGTKMRDIGSSMRGVGTQMSMALTLPIVGALGLGVKWAGEMEDAEAMTRQVFGAMSGDMERWAQDSAEKFGLSSGDALEWANQMGIRLRQIGGLSEQEAGRVAQNLTQLAGDFASAFGGTVDDAATAIGSALTGEFEPLKRYGIVINDAALKNKIFQMTGEDVKGTLSAQQKQTATLALIQEGASIVQGDYARNADGATNAQRTMTAALKDAATALGEVLLPYVTDAVKWITDLVDRFKNLSPETQKIIVIAGLLAAALGPVVYIVGVLATAIGFLFSPIGLVVAAIAALVAAFIYFYTTNDGFREWVDQVVDVVVNSLGVAFDWISENVIPKLVDAFYWVKDTAIPALVEAFNWMKENVWPLMQAIGERVAQVAGLIIGNITKVVQTVWPIWQWLWDKVWAVIQFVWPAIEATIRWAIGAIAGVIRFVTAIINADWGAAWDMVVRVAKGAWDWIVGIVTGGVQWVAGILRGAAGAIGGALDGAWSWMVGAARGGLDALVGFVQGIPGRITGVFSGAGHWLVDAGRAIMEGLLDGIKAAWDAVAGWVGGIAGKIKNLKGPIEVDAQLLIPEGKAIMAGLGKGLNVGFAEVRHSVAGYAPAIATTAASSMPTGNTVGGDGVHLHFHGPVSRDAEAWLLDVLATANRRGAAAIPGVR